MHYIDKLVTVISVLHSLLWSSCQLIILTCENNSTAENCAGSYEKVIINELGPYLYAEIR